MPLTQDQQTIFDAVITALRTNSKTIDQLTPQASLADSDYFELNGGRKVSYATLKSMFAALSDADIVNLNQAITNAKLKGVSIALTATGATLTVQSEGKSVSCAIPVAVYNSAADGEKKAGLMSAEDKYKLDATVNDRVNDRGLISDLQRWGQEAGWMVQRVTHGKDDASDVYAKVRMHKMDEPDSEPSYTEVVLVPAATEEAAGAMTAQQVKDLKLAKGLIATKGHAYGIAPLDSSALVPEKHLPDKVFDVLTFRGIDDSIYDLEAGSAAATPEDANASLVYSSVRDRFVLRVRETVSGGGISTNPPKYYGWFNGAERYGTADNDGIVPYENKLYLDLYDGGVYYWYDLMLRKTDLDVSIRVDSLENKIGKANGIAPLDANTMIPAEHIPATFRNVAHFAEVIDSKPGAVSPGTAPGAVGDDEVDVVFCEATKRFLFRYTPADGLGRLAYFCKIDGWKNLGESADENGVIPSAGKLYVNDKQGDALYWHGNALRPLRPAIKESDDIHTTIANPGTAGQSVQLNLTEAARKSLFCDLFNAAAGTAGYAKFTNGVWDCKLNGLTLSYDEAVLIYNVTNGSPATRGFSNAHIRTNLWNDLLGYGAGPANDICPALLFKGCTNIEVIRFGGWISDPRGMFSNCYKLTKVIGGFIGDTGWPKNRMTELFPNSPLITSFQLERLQNDVTFANNPLIDLDSFTYMVEHRTTENTNTYTITVHADVYAKLTGDTTNEAAAALAAEELSQWQALLTKAAGKNIAFASA